MCVSRLEIAKKLLKLIIVEIQGGLRSSMLIPLKKSSLLFIMICSMFMPICNCFHARRADSNKMTTFWGGSEITMSQQCGCNTRARVTKAPARLKGLVVPRNSRKKLKHTYKQRKLTIFLSQARSSAALC